jgi:formate--tetrahydrofolate ligase
MIPILRVAKKAEITKEFLEQYGQYIAKVDLSILKQLGERKGKLILVTAMNPTPYGEGKTTNSIGLSMALNALGHKSIVTLREPSLGPVFGLKGGATGGGKSRVVPSDRINLLFTSDMPAVAAAHNLLSAMIDNHVHQGNKLGLDIRRVYWPRTLDMNDRALREVIVGLGGRTEGFPREDEFVITAASEVMAILALAKDYSDLKKRLGNILVCRTPRLKEIHARDLKAEGAMAVVLKDAMKPNLIQTSEGTPAFVHAGPFANIAHGTNSIVSTDIALRLFDYVVTEAGFGADLGAEKYFNIVTRAGELNVDCVVIISTIRALKHHGDGDMVKGFPNLEKHIENIHSFGVPAVIALNRFPTDTDQEIAALDGLCKAVGVKLIVSEVFANGSKGGKDLALAVVETIEGSRKTKIKYTYNLSDSLKTKIEKVATSIYGAGEVDYTGTGRGLVRSLERRGYGKLPICIAKTQFSLSDRRRLLGRPTGFEVEIRNATVSAGAGYVVIHMGDINLMPGLPEEPAATGMDIDNDGNISGVF